MSRGPTDRRTRSAGAVSILNPAHLPPPRRARRDSGGDALDVAKAVLERALEKRTKDDVTVVAACFSPLGANAGASPPMEAGSFSLMTA